MTNLLRAAAALLALVLAAPANASTNLLVNGGFETGDFTGWIGHDLFGGIAVFSAPIDGISPEDGNYAFHIGPVFSDGGYLYQDWTDTPGVTYEITGWYAAEAPAGTGAEFRISAPGEPTFDTYDEPLFFQTLAGFSIPWTEFSYTYTGTGSEQLVIQAEQMSGDFFFDNFVVTQAPEGVVTQTPVPEPSTWAMLLVGFAGLGFMGWRGSRKTDAQAA